ncbi:MAG: adenylate/guanylate cyclase domain-containing protein [Betaproteobacteria bacterium]
MSVTAEELLATFARQLLSRGVAVARIAVFVRTLHPNVAGRAFFWRDDRAQVETDSAEHAWMDTVEHQASPVFAIWRDAKEVRRRLADPSCPMDYPVLPELRDEGMTDYRAVPILFMGGEIHVATFATRRIGGFTDADVAAIDEALPTFTRIAEITALTRKARNILDAYLGRQAGEKVLAGRIRRGDGEEIRAVIWFCDLRDSTPLAESMSRQAFLQLLNDYFEAVLGPVEARGGEILRFIGDAALAIWPIGNEPAAVACAQALAAAREALARMEDLNRRRKEAGERSLRFGIGLHLGLVLYGNIGTPTRIEFTVIGAAANEAARIESLCKSLNVNLILSEHVARHLTERPRSLGRHALRGVGEPIELFAGG